MASIAFKSPVSTFHRYPSVSFRNRDGNPPSTRVSQRSVPNRNSLSICREHFFSWDVYSPRWFYSSGLGGNGPSSCWRKRSVAAASNDESVTVDPEAKETRVKVMSEEFEHQNDEFKETWNDAVHNFKDVKAEDAAEPSVEESAENVMGVLRDTTEQLKEQAEKARAVLAATAQETAERSKENLTLLAENAPDPIKDIAATALNAHSLENAKKGSRIHDFCLGIPYGSLLAAGGLLWFIISGSTAAIRFGVILGGALLALSVASLKVWKQGKSSMPYIKAQAAITSIILIREIRRFFEDKAIFPTAVAVIGSAAMLGFYAYVYLSGGNPPKKAKGASAAYTS